MKYNIKQQLRNEVWSKDSYYNTAGLGSRDSGNLAMKILKEYANNFSNILDLGCGEGTRLNSLYSHGVSLSGIDISQKAIQLAKGKYKNIKFIIGDLEHLPFDAESFDMVYSYFVLEHLTDPEKALREAVRILEHNGILLLAAPNYGAPNRASPPYRGPRWLKLIKGFMKDIQLNVGQNIKWQKVLPIANNGGYDIDWDTVTEPYLGDLNLYLRKIGLRIIKSSSCWEEELAGAGTIQKIFRIFGGLNIYPFYNWGPHLLIVARKL